MKNKIIAAIEQEQLKKDMPEFRVGDTVVVSIRIKEEDRERLQAFEGVVIAKKNRGLNSAFTVRKVSHGEGVERVFQTHSKMIASVKVKRHGDVRKSKLYHLRQLSGRAARIKEKIVKKNLAEAMAVEPVAPATEELLLNQTPTITPAAENKTQANPESN